MTDKILAPQELPQSNAQFVAYGPETRVADPSGSGESIAIRPQVFVRYYRGAVVQDVVVGGRGGHDTVAIHFDPESLGLSEPIRAYLDTDDPLVEFFQEAQERKSPLDIGIEYARRKKAKSSKTLIDPAVPIHALRGADNPDGSGTASTMMSASGEHIRTVLGLVNGRRSKGTASDPAEWASLTGNRDGRLAPAGYRIYAPDEDWKVAGAITPSGTGVANGPGSTPAQGIAPADLRAMVQQVLTDTLTEAGVLSPPDVETAPARTRPVRRFSEGKRWDLRTNDGRINLGSYQAGGAAVAARWAHEHLNGRGYTPDSETTWSTAEQVLAVADRVQADAYGHGVQPNRADASHMEAQRWIQWAADHAGLPYPVAGEHDTHDAFTEACDTWARDVYALALDHLTRAGASVQTALEVASQRPTKAQKQHEPQQQGPSQATIKALLDAIHSAWDQQDVIGNLGRQVNERGFDNLPVSVAVGDDGTVSLAHPPTEGHEARTIDNVLRDRWAALAATAPEVEPRTQEDPAPESSTEQGDDLALLVDQINAAKDVDTIHRAYEAAKTHNLLQTRVYTNLDAPRPVAALTPDQGTDTTTVAAILNAVRVVLTGDAPAPDGGSDPTPAGMSAPEPQEGTDAQQIADQAAETADIDTIDRLIATAQEQHLDDATVTVDTVSGPLRGYLSSRRKRLTMVSA